MFVAMLGCGGDGTVSGDVAAIIPESSFLMLDADGDSYPLRATVYDGTGGVLDLPIRWELEDADIVAIADDRVSSLGTVGYTFATGVIGETRSRRVLVYTVRPATTALLVGDGQLVGDPEAVDDPTSIDLGMQFRVALRDIDAPAPGSLLLSRQTAPISGRVVSSTEIPDGAEVVYELVSFDDLFAEIDFEIEGPLDELSTEPIPGMATEALEFAFGPLECESSSESFDMTAQPIDIELIKSLDARLAARKSASGGIERLHLEVLGSFGVDARIGLQVPDPFTAEVKCELGLTPIPLPLPPIIPVSPSLEPGIGLDLTGTSSGTAVSIGATASLRADIRLGLMYTPATGLQPFKEVDLVDTPPELTFQLPDPSRIQLGVTAFTHAFAKLGVGLTFLPSVKLDIAQLRAGLQTQLTASLPDAQLTDPTRAAGYDAALIGDVGPGEHVTKLIRFLGLTDSLDLTYRTPPFVLAESPRGSFTVEPAAVAVGETVVGTVTLTGGSEEFLGFYNVDEVQIYRVAGGMGTLVGTVPSEVGQSVFNWSWTPSDTDVGSHTFAAMVVSDLLPGVPMEVENASARTVAVGTDIPPPAAGQVLFGSQSSPFDLWVMNADGSDQRLLATASSRSIDHPAWSPDGSMVAFSTGGSTSERIYVVDVDGTMRVPLTAGPSDTGPTWLPDGSEILFRRYIAATGENLLMAVDLDGVERVVADGAGNGRHIFVSPDGTQVVFVTTPTFEPNCTFAIAPVSGGTATCIGYGNTNPAAGAPVLWSSIGLLVQGSYYDATTMTNESGIYAWSTSGAGGTLLHAHSGYNWAPTGHTVAALDDPPDGASDLVFVAPDGSTTTIWPDCNCTAIIAPDASRVIARQSGNLYLVDVSGASMMPLPMPPDGARLYLYSEVWR